MPTTVWSPPRSALGALCAFLAALSLGACGPQSAAERGQALFSDPAFSPSPSNLFSCATCHAASPQSAADRQALRLAGGSLAGVVQRSALWCGRYPYLLDAVNTCLTTFMRGAALTADDPDGRALLGYLQTLPASAAPRPACTVVRTIDSTYLSGLPRGDAARGAAVYTAACALCHGQRGSGEGRLGARVSRVPDDTVATFGRGTAPAVVAEKIRHGKFYGIGGDMPPYTLETLSDAELADILSYLLP